MLVSRAARPTLRDSAMEALFVLLGASADVHADVSAAGTAVGIPLRRESQA